MTLHGPAQTVGAWSRFSVGAGKGDTCHGRREPFQDQVGSGSMTIAPHGHSATQIPQPLQ